MHNKVRIIAGEWRGKKLSFADAQGLRPTPARVRETLFNWLQCDIVASRCLDLYAGSGVLGMEAASRGAKSIVQVESQRQVCHQLKNNAELVGTNKIKIVQQDVFRYLAENVEKYDLIFLDPPFAKDHVVPVANSLEDKRCLAHRAKIYIEVERTCKLSGLPKNWTMLKHKTAGKVAYYLFQRAP